MTAAIKIGMEEGKAKKLIRLTLEAHSVMGAASDLSPRNPAINRSLAALVGAVLDTYSPEEERAVLGDPRIGAARPGLLRKLAQAEGEMEKYWAALFCERPEFTPADLRDFMYWDCYERLVGNEIAQMPPGIANGDGSAAFVGAGALPLTAIILHLRTGMKVTCIDSDPQACALASALCRKAGLSGVDVLCADGRDHDYGAHSAVFIASLVPEKDAVINRIGQTRPGAVIGVRSAERLHTLLYDPVDEFNLRAAGCVEAGRTSHDTKSINTTLFYRLAPRSGTAVSAAHQQGGQLAPPL